MLSSNIPKGFLHQEEKKEDLENELEFEIGQKYQADPELDAMEKQQILNEMISDSSSKTENNEKSEKEKKKFFSKFKNNKKSYKETLEIDNEKSKKYNIFKKPSKENLES